MATAVYSTIYFYSVRMTRIFCLVDSLGSRYDIEKLNFCCCAMPAPTTGGTGRIAKFDLLCL